MIEQIFYFPGDRIPSKPAFEHPIGFVNAIKMFREGTGEALKFSKDTIEINFPRPTYGGYVYGGGVDPNLP